MTSPSITTSQTILSNIVHAKPLSHQIFRGIRHLGTLLVQGANPEIWHGEIRISLAKVLVVAGYVANIAISIIETLAGLALSITASIIYCKRKEKSQTLQNITVKLIGYTINALLVTITQIVCLYRRFYPEHRGINVLVNHGLHITSFACSQFVGSLFDTLHENNEEEEVSENEFFPSSIDRATNGLMEIIPAAINDMMRSVSHDAATLERNLPVINQEEFTNSFSRLQGNFSFSNLNDPAYRQSLYQFIITYYIQPLLPSFTTQDLSGNFLMSIDKKDDEYQNSLVQHIKESIISLHNNESFLHMLSKEEDDLSQIRENLLTASYTPQVCNYAQFLELEKPISCPQAFNSSQMNAYNHRYQKLVETQQLFSTLTKDEIDILLQKLLETGSFDLEKISLNDERKKILKKLFTNIGELSGALHQGTLLTRSYVDRNLLANEQFLEAFQSKSRMSEAYEEADKILTKTS